MSKHVSNISRLNALYSALGIKWRAAEAEYNKLFPEVVRELDDAPRGGFRKVGDAIEGIIQIRKEILETQMATLRMRSNVAFGTDRGLGTLPATVRDVARIAAEFGLDGYIAEHAEEFVDKDALYRVCYDVEREDGNKINRTIIRDRMPYDVAFKMGQEFAATLGLKESYLHGQWMTVMPCEVEETVKVEKI